MMGSTPEKSAMMRLTTASSFSRRKRWGADADVALEAHHVSELVELLRLRNDLSTMVKTRESSAPHRALVGHGDVVHVAQLAGGAAVLA